MQVFTFKFGMVNKHQIYNQQNRNIINHQYSPQQFASLIDFAIFQMKKEVLSNQKKNKRPTHKRSNLIFSNQQNKSPEQYKQLIRPSINNTTNIEKSIDDRIQHPRRPQKYKPIKQKLPKSNKTILFKIKTLKNIDNFYTFIHTLPLTIIGNSRFEKSISKIKNKEKPKRYPRQIIDILYKQNIPNYNPYVQALQKCQETVNNQKDRFKLKMHQIQQIRKLCYIGIAKNYLRNKKFGNTPKYSKVNILIRTYMYQKMKQIIQQKSQNYENIIYIPTETQGLSFSAKKYPNQLLSILKKQIFSDTLRKVNKIIQKEYVNYKKINMEKVQEDNVQIIFYCLLGLFLFIYWLTNNSIAFVLIAFAILGFVVANFITTSKNLDKLVSTKNVSNRIRQKIEEFFKQISSQTVEWKVGEDFYWLQIHFIKKIKSKSKNKLFNFH